RDRMPALPDPRLLPARLQLAIAPVVLLSGVAGLLNVMAGRLARVIDRPRTFETPWAILDTQARAAARVELAGLEKRRRACSRSITYCTTAALLICVVIVTLFVEEFLSVNLRLFAGAIFVATMIALIGGLTCFLREV